jgi:MYXO-CTERM domain-containing protein
MVRPQENPMLSHLASNRSWNSLFVGALALAAPLLVPNTAHACGGTFCDTGPNAMPVDQTGENILFHLGATSVEAHIQIQYDPNSGAEKFAWVIPVTAIPEFEVGSQFLFNAMLNSSVPSYGLSTSFDFCGDGNSTGLTGPAQGGDGDGDGGDGDGGQENDEPEVVLKTTVGAFEIAVLQGGTVEGVMQWLGENGYQQDPAAEPILAQYLAEEFLFVAMRLSNRAGVDEIHPIVIRYEGDEPCVPIRLTAIAAVEDMDIRTFFLQDARVVPVNYRHVLVNPLKLDWLNNAANYKEVISMAVDAQEADGNAFVTEFAAPHGIPTFNINPGWSSAPFAAYIDSPIGVIEELAQQSLLDCDPEWGTECTFIHPLIEPILDEFIPVPDGMSSVEFYNCLSCFAAQIDLSAWNAGGFVQRLDERIILPAERAVALVEANPYLTRMYTTISPLEMNADPIFKINTSLPDVPNVRIANQTNHCDGSATVTLPDGRQVYFPDSTDMTWPDFGDEMPWEEEVDQEAMADNGPLVNLVDNTDKIDELLRDHNTREQTAVTDGLGNGGNCVCSVDDRGRAGALLGLVALSLLGLVRRRRS